MMHLNLQGSGSAKIQCVRQHSVKILMSLSNVNNKHCRIPQSPELMQTDAVTLMFCHKEEILHQDSINKRPHNSQAAPSRGKK